MSRRAWVLLAVWCGILALGVLWVESRLTVSADLRLFMPSPRTEEQRLLVQNIGESPASRLLLIAVSGDTPASLADVSKRFARGLQKHTEFGLVANGEQAPLAVPDRLLPYRYLLTDAFDHEPLSGQRLSAEIQDRVSDMGSPAAGFLEEWLPRDPTLELLHLATRWQPHSEPDHVDGVWFSQNRKDALLLLETHAAAFDPDGQTSALAAIQEEFAAARGGSPAVLTVSGSGYFSSVIKQHTQAEASWFGAAATLGMIVLMWTAYRSVAFTLLGALPLISAGLAGLGLVTLLYDGVHGITLAFGFTLIGVGQDYPIHLFSHLVPGEPPTGTARRVWPPLAMGVASTCLAYLSFLMSGVTGLSQLACLTVTGLMVAGLTTRFLLPLVVVTPGFDHADSPRMGWLNAQIEKLPRALSLVVIIPVAAAAVFLLRPHGFWQHDLSKLTPVPQALLERDAELRHEMATPDMRYLLVASGDSEDQVLASLEALERDLAAAAHGGALSAWEHAADYLPSAAVQRRRQAALPDEIALRAMLKQATADSPFEDGLFEPFVADVQRARALPPLTEAGLADTPLSLRVGAELFERENRWHGLVSLFGVKDPAALARVADAHAGVLFLDLKAASEQLVAAQRAHIIQSLYLAAALLVAVVWLALRKPARVLRVVLPMVLTILVVLAVLRAFGVSLSLFHLVSLVLGAGLGLDYALFFEHAASDPAEQRRTLHALLVCAASTLLVFALLALSSTPLLQAIGVTVALSVLCNFLLSLLLTRERARP